MCLSGVGREMGNRKVCDIGGMDNNKKVYAYFLEI